MPKELSLSPGMSKSGMDSQLAGVVTQGSVWSLDDLSDDFSRTFQTQFHHWNSWSYLELETFRHLSYEDHLYCCCHLYSID